MVHIVMPSMYPHSMPWHNLKLTICVNADHGDVVLGYIWVLLGCESVQ